MDTPIKEGLFISKEKYSPENVVERERRMEMGERIGIKGIDQIEPEMRIMSTIKSSQDMKWICNEGALAPRVRESLATRAVMSS